MVKWRVVRPLLVLLQFACFVSFSFVKYIFRCSDFVYKIGNFPTTETERNILFKTNETLSVFHKHFYITKQEADWPSAHMGQRTGNCLKIEYYDIIKDGKTLLKKEERAGLFQHYHKPPDITWWQILKLWAIGLWDKLKGSLLQS